MSYKTDSAAYLEVRMSVDGQRARAAVLRAVEKMGKKAELSSDDHDEVFVTITHGLVQALSNRSPGVSVRIHEAGDENELVVRTRIASYMTHRIRLFHIPVSPKFLDGKSQHDRFLALLKAELQALDGTATARIGNSRLEAKAARKAAKARVPSTPPPEALSPPVPAAVQPSATLPPPPPSGTHPEAHPIAAKAPDDSGDDGLESPTTRLHRRLAAPQPIDEPELTIPRSRLRGRPSSTDDGASGESTVPGSAPPKATTEPSDHDDLDAPTNPRPTAAKVLGYQSAAPSDAAPPDGETRDSPARHAPPTTNDPDEVDARVENAPRALGSVAITQGLLVIGGVLAPAVSRGSIDLSSSIAGWPIVAMAAFLVVGGFDARRGSRISAAAVGAVGLGFSVLVGLLVGAVPAVAQIGTAFSVGAGTGAQMVLWSAAIVLGFVASLDSLELSVTSTAGDRRESPLVGGMVVLIGVAVAAGVLSFGSGGPRWATLITPSPWMTAANLSLVTMLVAAVIIASVRRTGPAFGLLMGVAFVWTMISLPPTVAALQGDGASSSALDQFLVGCGSALLLFVGAVAGVRLRSPASALPRGPIAGVGASGQAAMAGSGATSMTGAASSFGVTGAAVGSTKVVVVSLACWGSVAVAAVAGVASGVAAASQPSASTSGTWLESAYAGASPYSWESGAIGLGWSYRAPIGSATRSSGGGASTSGPSATDKLSVITVPCTTTCKDAQPGASASMTTPPTSTPPTQPASAETKTLVAPTGPPQVTATARSRCPAQNCKIYLRYTPNDDLSKPADRWLLDNQTIDLYCEDAGQFVRDNDTGRTSTVWYKTESGAYMSGIYLDLNNQIQSCGLSGEGK